METYLVAAMPRCASVVRNKKICSSIHSKKYSAARTNGNSTALKPLVQAINELEPAITKLTDGQLQAKTGEFRERLSRGETLDDLLVEAFAVVREASRRTLGSAISTCS